MADRAPKGRALPRIAMIVAIPLWSVVTLVGAGMLVMSPMLFDSPSSTENPWLLLGFGGLVCTPILGLGSSVASVVGLVFEALRPWPLWAVLIVVLAPLAALAAVGAGVLGLQVFCDGQFSC